jgi:pyruvate dehydrogenase E1 component alpha subunit
MLLIRRFEERMQELFVANRLAGFLHLSIGQEAVAVGTCAALTRSDYIVTTHRGHGHIIAKGGNVNRMVAELFARETGSCSGMGGSMHLTDPDVGVLCADAIVGASIGLATGAAFSAQYRSSNQVAVAFFGDGAANQGIFHESLNLAALWKLPVIFVCENNLYAEMSRQSSQSLVADIASRAVSYGMPGSVVDGNDVDAVLAATATAVELARGGYGPTLLECKTYRTRGHFEGDQQKYKEASEVAHWEARDPIELYRRKLEPDHLDLDAIDREVTDLIGQAIALAEQAPEASVADLQRLTYADDIPSVPTANVVTRQ